jgi:hypothetical protein
MSDFFGGQVKGGPKFDLGTLLASVAGAFTPFGGAFFGPPKAAGNAPPAPTGVLPTKPSASPPPTLAGSSPPKPPVMHPRQVRHA